MTKTPWHIWLVGIFALLWNAGGAYDFTMSATQNASYMANFTPEQIAYFSGFPILVMITWGIAVWSAVIGSILILLRNGLAMLAFALGFVMLVVTAIYNYILADTNIIEIAGTGAALFSLVIFIVAILLLLYTKNQKSRGILR